MRNKKFLKIIATCLFVAFWIVIFCSPKAKAFVDTKKGSVETKESFSLPELFKKGSGTLIDWSIEKTSDSTKVGGSVTVDSDGNVVSLSSDTSYGKYYLTSKGLEGIWAVGGSGDFGHILSYKELNDVCLNGKNFHSISDHKDWTDEGTHQMVCSVYDKFKTISCGFDCSHKNNYEYSFDYQIKKSDVWTTITGDNVNKCEDLKVIFFPKAEWFADLTHSCQEKTGGSEGSGIRLQRRIDLLSPATSFSSCIGKEDCLSKATEANLTTGVYAKGIEKVNADFISSTQKSLSGGVDTSLQCDGNGKCVAYLSGKHSLSASASESQYYGQCRADATSETVSGETLNIPLIKISPPAVSISQITSAYELNVINRAPLVSVTLSKSSVAVNEEVTATCDIVDPDSCSDKIVKVKWVCLNAQKQKVNCYFGKDGIWKEGEVSEEIPEDKQKFEYRSIVKWKAGVKGIYAITCEGTDNDLASSQTGIGGTGISVDSGEVAAQMKFCAVLSEEGGTNKTVCGDTAKVNLKAYQFGIDAGKYEWKCKNTDTFTAGASTKECAYSEGGTFVPGLRIFDNKSSSWIDCTSDNNTVKVANKAKCSVLVRSIGSTEDYKPEVSITSGNQIEAKIERECTKDSDKTVWTTDGTKVSEGNTKAVIKYLSGGIGSVKANIGGTTCTGASVNISEKVKMGN